YRLFAEAAAAINIHGDQDGLTMRTFEVCGMGGVQLIDRADLQGLYDDGAEVAAYGSTAELIELCRRAASDRAWAVGLREAGRARTLAEHTFDHRVHTLEKLWV
ncbi:MAG: glycosyltransferase, partial [Nocardioides sp.]